jgi:hypothetical protein
LEFIDSLLADKKYLSLRQRLWKVVYTVQIQCRECRELLTNVQSPLYFLAEAIPGFIYIKFYHWANNRSMYAEGFYNSMIDDKDGHILSPLIMFTCTASRHALLEWEKNKGAHLKASKSKLKAERPDRSNYYNYKNDGGKVASCCAATGSVSNGSGPSLRVRVRVGTEPEPDWRSGSSINPNCRFGYGSIDISLPV